MEQSALIPKNTRRLVIPRTVQSGSENNPGDGVWYFQCHIGNSDIHSIIDQKFLSDKCGEDHVMRMKQSTPFWAAEGSDCTLKLGCSENYCYYCYGSDALMPDGMDDDW